jgi:hypothetical protein
MSHNLGQLKMQPSDGIMRMTDVAGTEKLLRLLQSIPSPNAEKPEIFDVIVYRASSKSYENRKLSTFQDNAKQISIAL